MLPIPRLLPQWHKELWIQSLELKLQGEGRHYAYQGLAGLTPPTPTLVEGGGQMGQLGALKAAGAAGQEHTAAEWATVGASASAGAGGALLAMAAFVLTRGARARAHSQGASRVSVRKTLP